MNTKSKSEQIYTWLDALSDNVKARISLSSLTLSTSSSPSSSSSSSSLSTFSTFSDELTAPGESLSICGATYAEIQLFDTLLTIIHYTSTQTQTQTLPPIHYRARTTDSVYPHEFFFIYDDVRFTEIFTQAQYDNFIALLPEGYQIIWEQEDLL